MNFVEDRESEQQLLLPQMVEIPKHTLEYENVLYKLHLATRRSDSVTNVKIWDIQNPHVAVRFDRAAAGKLTLDCLLDPDSWGNQNTVESIRSCGVQFPQDGSGMEFFHGCLPNGKTDRQNGPCMFVLASVAVGRSAVVPTRVPSVGEVEMAPGSSEDRKSEDQFTPVDEEKYDSIYHETPVDDTEEAAHKDGNKYIWSYYMKDQDKVFPKYLITCEYEGSDITDGKVQLCEMCEEVPAIFYCNADDAKLCEKCDTEMHMANKVVAKHKRVPLKDFKKKKRRLSLMQQRMGDTLQIFNSKCPLHPKVEVEFYCQACEIPVCVHCKMVGNHSSGEMGIHKLIGIGSAWQQAVDIANVPDNILDARKEAIAKHLEAISEKRIAVDNNAIEKDLRVREMAREALTQIAVEAQRKRDCLRAEELELFRQHQEILWSEYFLVAQRESLLPVEFLSTWKRHKRVRELLYSYDDKSPLVLSEVHPDLAVSTSKIQVLSNDSNVLENLPELDDTVDENTDKHTEDDESAALAPLTNRFATLTREFNKRPSLQTANAAQSSADVGGSFEKCGTINDIWMQTLGRSVSKENNGDK